jgi:DNA-binding response OmpR family regulator
MERVPDSSLIIGVATSTAERVHLARLLSGADALLLVSSAEQARTFLALTSAAESIPVVMTPTVLPTAAQDELTAQIGAIGRTQEAAEAQADVVPTAQVSAAVPAQAASAVPAAQAASALPPSQAGCAVPIAGLRLDVDRRVAQWKDREVPLTRLEHDFLHCLVKEPGQVWTYQRLHHAVWGNEHLGHGSHIHSVVKRLRQKLTSLGASVTIHAVRGVGFHLLPAA